MSLMIHHFFDRLRPITPCCMHAQIATDLRLLNIWNMRLKSLNLACPLPKFWWNIMQTTVLKKFSLVWESLNLTCFFINHAIFIDFFLILPCQLSHGDIMIFRACEMM